MSDGSCSDNSTCPVCVGIVKVLEIAGMPVLPDRSASLRLAWSQISSLSVSSLIHLSSFETIKVKYLGTPSDDICRLSCACLGPLSWSSHDGGCNERSERAWSRSLAEGLVYICGRSNTILDLAELERPKKAGSYHAEAPAQIRLRQTARAASGWVAL